MYLSVPFYVNYYVVVLTGFYGSERSLLPLNLSAYPTHTHKLVSLDFCIIENIKLPRLNLPTYHTN
jgi:hypothetical protein